MGIISFANLFRQLRDEVNRILRPDGNSRQQQQGPRQGSSYGNRPGVYDRRTPEQANKKIFKEDEGEYVDYEEE